MIDFLVTMALVISAISTALLLYFLNRFLKLSLGKKWVTMIVAGIVIFPAIMWLVINVVGFWADRI